VNTIVIVSLSALHKPLPVVVRMRLILPELISPDVGAYVALREVPPGENNPSPPDHCPPLAMLTFPLKVTIALFAQSV
jgi:hypothetical protein